MLRYRVTRQWVKHKGKMYLVGELLPVEFSEREKFRNIYSSRIASVDVPDEELAVEGIEIPGIPVQDAPPIVPEKELKAEITPAVPSEPTGTAAPGETTKAVVSTKVAPVVTTTAKSISGQTK